MIRIILLWLAGFDFNIKNTFNIMKERKWNEVYIFVDIHGTILKPDYGGLAKEYYPFAKKTLQMLSKSNKIKLFMYTCSYPNEITEYVEFFKKDGIYFDAINKNPYVENTRGGYFQEKQYFNILLDDKANIVAEYDWYLLYFLFKKYI